MEPTIPQKLIEQCFNQSMFYQIMEYCTLQELAKAQLVCKQWSHWVEQPYLFKQIEFSTQEQNIPNTQDFLKWLIKKIHKFPPQKLTIYDNENQWTFEKILELFQYDNPNLQKANLFFDLQEYDHKCLTQLLALKCPNLKTIKTCGKFLSDENSQFIAQNCKNLQNLSIDNDDMYFEGLYLKEFPEMRKIFLRPHLIEFDNLFPLIKKSQRSLVKLGIDCEYYEQHQMEKLLDTLFYNNFESLQLYYCENFDENLFLNRICKFKNLRQLKFRKGISIEKEPFIKIAQQIQTTQLRKLDLSECTFFSDQALTILLEKLYNLTHLKINWCSNLSDLSLSKIFDTCRNLVSFEGQGLKKCTDGTFTQIHQKLLPKFNPEQMKKSQQGLLKNYLNYDFAKQKDGDYFKEFAQIFFTEEVPFHEITHYQKMKFLDLQKSDFVSDELQFILKLIRPYITILNYYGEEVRLDSKYGIVDDKEY